MCDQSAENQINGFLSRADSGGDYKWIFHTIFCLGPLPDLSQIEKDCVQSKRRPEMTKNRECLLSRLKDRNKNSSVGYITHRPVITSGELPLFTCHFNRIQNAFQSLVTTPTLLWPA